MGAHSQSRKFAGCSLSGKAPSSPYAVANPVASDWWLRKRKSIPTSSWDTTVGRSADRVNAGLPQGRPAIKPGR